jgi:hypothetical protein
MLTIWKEEFGNDMINKLFKLYETNKQQFILKLEVNFVGKLLKGKMLLNTYITFKM